MAIRRRQQQPMAYEEEEEYMGSSYEEEEEEIHAPLADIQSSVRAMPKDDEHMKLTKPQEIFVDIEFTGSPEEFEQGTAVTDWRFMDHVLPALKENMADKNRNNASDEQLIGSLKRVIVGGFDIVMHANGLPYPGKLKANHGFANGTVSQHGASLWRVNAKCPTQIVKESAFKPDSPIQQKMFDRYTLCTEQDLEADIPLTAPTKTNPQGLAHVVIDSPAYDKLVYNMRIGKFHADEFTDAEWNRIMAPPADVRSVEVPYPVASVLKENMKSEVTDFLDRCVSLQDLVFSFERDDGVAQHNNIAGYVGELVQAEADPGNALTSASTTTRQTFYVKAKLQYRLLP